MITTISKRISHYLLEHHVIAAEELEIYQYGFEIIVSTILGTVIVLLIGTALGMLLLSVLYCVMFVFLRQIMGGYHADTYLKCNLMSGILSFCVLGLTRVLAASGLYSWSLHMLLLLFSLPVILLYAPLGNPNKPLGKAQKTRNRLLSIASFLTLSAVSVLLMKTAPAVSALIGLTLFLAVTLLLIGKFLGKEEES